MLHSEGTSRVPIVNVKCCAVPGGFTSLDPESRRVKPDPKGRPVVKIVYTVLESQYQSSLTAAVQAINAGSDQVCYELIGYLLEELRTPENYDNFKKDLEDANVFIGSLIFIEDLAEKVYLPPADCHGVSQCSLGSACNIDPKTSVSNLPFSANKHFISPVLMICSCCIACMWVGAEYRPQFLCECRSSRLWSQTAANWTHV